jgi:catalase
MVKRISRTMRSERAQDGGPCGVGVGPIVAKPDATLIHLSRSHAVIGRAPDFLSTELAERLKRQPVTFQLKAQLAAAPGDPTHDSTRASRGLVDLGVITIARVVPNSDEARERLLFMPTQLTYGIAASDDPFIQLRSSAYTVSYSRRDP